MSLQHSPSKSLFTDLSLYSLLLSNILTIFFAVTEGWNLTAVMWVYWFQNIVLGVFNVIRILNLNEFSTANFRINNQPATATATTKYFTAFFFAIHYGLFHFVYMIFLITGSFTSMFGSKIQSGDIGFILISALIFLLNHLFSYVYNKPRDTKNQNIGTLMFYPYARIIPMHLTIILAMPFGPVALPFFLVLKTGADVVMHLIEHGVIRKNEEKI